MHKGRHRYGQVKMERKRVAIEKSEAYDICVFLSWDTTRFSGESNMESGNRFSLIKIGLK